MEKNYHLTSGLRLLRLPSYYLPSVLLLVMSRTAQSWLKIIADVHQDIPNLAYWKPQIKTWVYYPSFLIWIYDKSSEELGKRYGRKPTDLSDRIRNLKSRSINNFLPPTEIELATDIVYMYRVWSRRAKSLLGMIALPDSYLQLVDKHYGCDAINKDSFEGATRIPGAHHNSDSDWYFLPRKAT